MLILLWPLKIGEMMNHGIGGFETTRPRNEQWISCLLFRGAQANSQVYLENCLLSEVYAEGVKLRLSLPPLH